MVPEQDFVRRKADSAPGQVAVGAAGISPPRLDLKGEGPVGLNLDDKKAVVAEVSAQVANAQTIALSLIHI